MRRNNLPASSRPGLSPRLLPHLTRPKAQAISRHTMRAVTPLRRPVCSPAAASPGGGGSGSGGALSRAAKDRIADMVNEELALRLAQQCGLPREDVPDIKRAIANIASDAQAALRQHGVDVAFLAAQRLSKQELAELLRTRLDLFSKPVSDISPIFQALGEIRATPAQPAAFVDKKKLKTLSKVGSCWLCLHCKDRRL